MVKDPGTAAGAGGFRPLNEPAPAAVEATARGIPKAVLWRGAYKHVTAIHDSWRIDDEWWREEIARRYFVAEVEGGRRITLFHDLVRDAWYVQPYVDVSAYRRGA
jgi:hypothetical protein